MRPEPRATVVWVTGLPQSGKSTLAQRLAALLEMPHCVLDSDEIRNALVPKRSYDDQARDDFYASLGNLAELLARQGLLVIVAATANLRHYRDRIRERPSLRFIEVFVDASIETCRARDQKNLYDSVGPLLPGVGQPYEPPLSPDVRASGGSDSDALSKLVSLVGQPDGRR